MRVAGAPCCAFEQMTSHSLEQPASPQPAASSFLTLPHMSRPSCSPPGTQPRLLEGLQGDRPAGRWHRGKQVARSDWGAHQGLSRSNAAPARCAIKCCRLLSLQATPLLHMLRNMIAIRKANPKAVS